METLFKDFNDLKRKAKTQHKEYIDNVSPTEAKLIFGYLFDASVPVPNTPGEYVPLMGVCIGKKDAKDFLDRYVEDLMMGDEDISEMEYKILSSLRFYLGDKSEAHIKEYLSLVDSVIDKICKRGSGWDDPTYDVVELFVPRDFEASGISAHIGLPPKPLRKRFSTIGVDIAGLKKCIDEWLKDKEVDNFDKLSKLKKPTMEKVLSLLPNDMNFILGFRDKDGNVQEEVGSGLKIKAKIQPIEREVKFLSLSVEDSPFYPLGGKV